MKRRVFSRPGINSSLAWSFGGEHISTAPLIHSLLPRGATSLKVAGQRFVKRPPLSHSIKLEMLWELMRLYDWRIITSWILFVQRTPHWPFNWPLWRESHGQPAVSKDYRKLLVKDQSHVGHKLGSSQRVTIDL